MVLISSASWCAARWRRHFLFIRTYGNRVYYGRKRRTIVSFHVIVVDNGKDVGRKTKVHPLGNPRECSKEGEQILVQVPSEG